MRRGLGLLCAASSLAARGTADSTALYQQVVRLQRNGGWVPPPQAAELTRHSASTQAQLDGPKAKVALKLAMSKVDDLPMPGSLEASDTDKEGIRKKIAACFSDMLNATQATWLLAGDEMAVIERRFNRKALRHISKALKSGRRFSSPHFWPQFWAQSKHSFAKAVFHDEKALMKPEWVDSETSTTLEEVMKPLKYAKHRRGAGAFNVTLGPCAVDSEGCLTSPDYPNNYTNRDVCIISVNKSLTGPMEVVAFDTESLADILTVNGIRYSGKKGPEGVWPQEEMVWFSDYILAGSGFKICPTPPRAEAPSPPLHLPLTFTVDSGDCSVDSTGCATSTNYPEGYPAYDSCVINVTKGSDEPMHVEDFSTEDFYDTLTVNGQDYSGIDGPEGVVPKGQIRWAADNSYNSKGWKLCPLHLSEQLGASNNSVFTVRVGGCAVGPDGCIESPKYPELYPNGGICTIGVNTLTAGPLRVEQFNTEMGYDSLIVNGMRFSGVRGPEGIVPHEDIIWFADYEASASGWRLCSGLPEPPAAISSSENATGSLTVTDGNCTVADGCVSSPNYPRRYGNDQHCTIDVADGNTLPLRVVDFSTENQLDALIINGEAYSGINGPEGVIPHGQIEWSSDSSVRAGGWKVCFVVPPEVPTTTTTAATTNTSTTTTPTTTTNTTAATTTTTTTTTTTPEPSAWDDLSYHMEVSREMVLALVSLVEKASLLDKSATRFRKSLVTVQDFRPSTHTPLSWHVLFVNGSISTALEPWVEFSDALKPAFNMVAEAISAHNDTSRVYERRLFEGSLDISQQADQFQRKVLWFAVEMVRQHLSLVEQTPEVLTSKFEALKVPIRTFRTELNEFLENAFTDFDAVPTFFKRQVSEPFKYVGLGHCLDSEDHVYDTLTSDGCSTVFWCSDACRKLNACQGFNVRWLQNKFECARCDLRVEEGYSGSIPFWNYTWAGGNGHGPIASASGTSVGYDSMPLCIGRSPYNRTGWTPRMLAILEQEQAKQVDKYQSASEMWVYIASTLKTAFWKILSGLEHSTEKVIQAELRAAQASNTDTA